MLVAVVNKGVWAALNGVQDFDEPVEAEETTLMEWDSADVVVVVELVLVVVVLVAVLTRQQALEEEAQEMPDV
jgi:hypothetical protein